MQNSLTKDKFFLPTVSVGENTTKTQTSGKMRGIFSYLNKELLFLYIILVQGFFLLFGWVLLFCFGLLFAFFLLVGWFCLGLGIFVAFNFFFLVKIHSFVHILSKASENLTWVCEFHSSSCILDSSCEFGHRSYNYRIIERLGCATR